MFARRVAGYILKQHNESEGYCPVCGHVWDAHENDCDLWAFEKARAEEAGLR